MASRYDSTIDVDLPNNTHSSLVRLVGRDRRVLELGASSGYMTAVLVERGCVVTAVEVDEDAVRELRGHADEVVVGDLNDPAVLAGVRGPFDVVLAGDVLEHLLDPVAVLRAAVACLAPGGEVVLSVPNLDHVDLRLTVLQGGFHYTETGLLDSTHMRFFTYTLLLDLLNEVGLLPTSVERIVAGPFSTELALHPESIPPEVVTHALDIPESETYQFVVRAVPATGDERQVAEAMARLKEQAEEEATRRDATSRDLRERSATPRREELFAQVDRLQGFLLTAELDRDEARSLLEHREGELDGMRDAAATLREEFRAQVDRLQAFLLTAELDRDEARSVLEDRQRESDGMRDDVASLEEEVATVRRELTAACIGESQRSSLQERVAQLTHELDECRLERQELHELKGSRAYAVVYGYRSTRHLLGRGRRRLRKMRRRV